MSNFFFILLFYVYYIYFEARNSKNRWPVKSIDHNRERSCIASTCQAFKDDIATIRLVSLELCTSPKTSLRLHVKNKKQNLKSVVNFWFHVQLWLDGIIPNCCGHGWYPECRGHGVSLFGGEFRFYFLYTIQVRYILFDFNLIP